MVRIWIPSTTLFPLSPAELDGARKRVDGEPPRRGDEPGALWAGEEQTAYFRLWTLMIESISFMRRAG